MKQGSKNVALGQKGFTLIELIVIIVILGILAAVAIPRFVDIQTEARIAKMQGAVGAIKGAAATAHAAWLVKGGTSVTMEGATVPIRYGYPDVGGDGDTNTATSGSNSGIVIAAGGLTDYNIVAGTSATTITFSPDSSHTDCVVVYTEPAGTNQAPTIDSTALTSANCD